MSSDDRLDPEEKTRFYELHKARAMGEGQDLGWVEGGIWRWM